MSGDIWKGKTSRIGCSSVVNRFCHIVFTIIIHKFRCKVHSGSVVYWFSDAQSLNSAKMVVFAFRSFFNRSFHGSLSTCTSVFLGLARPSLPRSFALSFAATSGLDFSSYHQSKSRKITHFQSKFIDRSFLRRIPKRLVVLVCCMSEKAYRAMETYKKCQMTPTHYPPFSPVDRHRPPRWSVASPYRHVDTLLPL